MPSVDLHLSICLSIIIHVYMHYIILHYIILYIVLYYIILYILYIYTIYVCEYTTLYIHTYIHIYIYIHTYIHTYIYICIYIYMYRYTYIYICMCVCARRVEGVCSEKWTLVSGLPVKHLSARTPSAPSLQCQSPQIATRPQTSSTLKPCGLGLRPQATPTA